MREKYESLSLAVLKDLAKARGMKRISTLKKADLIERMLQQDEADAKAAAPETEGKRKEEAVAPETKGTRKAEADAAVEKQEEAGRERVHADEPEAEEKKAETVAAQDDNAENTETKKGRPVRTPRKTERKPLKHGVQRAGRDSSGDKSGEGRTYGKKEGSSEKRTYTKRESAPEARAYGKRENAAEEHGYGKRENVTEERSYGKRENTTEERGYGKRDNTTEERGYGKRENTTEERGYGKRENTTEEHSYGKRENATEERGYVKRDAGADSVHEDVKYRDDKREHTKNGRPERRQRPVIITGDAETDEKLKSVDDRTLQRIEAEGVTLDDLDSGIDANGILEVMPDGYGFIRCENYLPGDNDIYVAPSQIRRFKLKTGDILTGHTRVRSQNEKFSALLYIGSVNGINPTVASKRTPFEDLTPIFPNERLHLETSSSRVSMRILDLIAPVGKGQRGMIVSQPKAGKTTLLKEIAKSIKKNNPEMHLIILLIDERPEEVTDIKEAIEGENVEVIYYTFDELPEHHKRVSEMVIERAKRLVEHKQDVMILLDSITRLARAYNMVVPPSGRTLSGGLDPTALHMPKRFFGAARNMREGGSLTILATALVDTGSRMDDVVYEEFKGTGNMELILDRKLSEKRIFPAIDIVKSGTRRDDLLLDKEEQEAVEIMRRSFNGMKSDDAVEAILRMFLKTRTNRDFIHQVLHRKFF